MTILNNYLTAGQYTANPFTVSFIYWLRNKCKSIIGKIICVAKKLPRDEKKDYEDGDAGYCCFAKKKRFWLTAKLQSQSMKREKKHKKKRGNGKDSDEERSSSHIFVAQFSASRGKLGSLACFFAASHALYYMAINTIVLYNQWSIV